MSHATDCKMHLRDFKKQRSEGEDYVLERKKFWYSELLICLQKLLYIEYGQIAIWGSDTVSKSNLNQSTPTCQIRKKWNIFSSGLYCCSHRFQNPKELVQSHWWPIHHPHAMWLHSIHGHLACSKPCWGKLCNNKSFLSALGYKSTTLNCLLQDPKAISLTDKHVRGQLISCSQSPREDWAQLHWVLTHHHHQLLR